jgi:hypothetical protein
VAAGLEHHVLDRIGVASQPLPAGTHRQKPQSLLLLRFILFFGGGVTNAYT